MLFLDETIHELSLRVFVILSGSKNLKFIFLNTQE
jgi:hypothetical protein